MAGRHGPHDRVIVAIGQVGKFASVASGDMVEVVRRPAGAYSVILVDGQGSGPRAKALSALLVGRAAALVRDGTRDVAVLASVHDFLLAYRNGLVSAPVDLITVDPVAGHIRLARQSFTPAALGDGTGFKPAGALSGPIGRWRVEPVATVDTPLIDGATMVVTTDGISQSGNRRGGPPLDLTADLTAGGMAGQSPDDIAAVVLALGRERDGGRPGDDMTVVVVDVRGDPGEDHSLAMRVSFPVPSRKAR